MRIIVCVIALAACKMSLDESQVDGGQDVGGTCAAAVGRSDLAWLQANVFSKSCTFGACHSGDARQADRLVLTDGRTHDQLVNVASVESSSWKRVVAGDPDHSYLLVALGSIGGPPPHDGIMPLGSAQLCSEKLSAIRAWIAAGAQP
jgi:hypothetical protein